MTRPSPGLHPPTLTPPTCREKLPPRACRRVGLREREARVTSLMERGRGRLREREARVTSLMERGRGRLALSRSVVWRRESLVRRAEGRLRDREASRSNTGTVCCWLLLVSASYWNCMTDDCIINFIFHTHTLCPRPDLAPHQMFGEGASSGLCTRASSGMCTRPSSGRCTRPSSGMCTRPSSGLCTRPSSGMCTRPTCLHTLGSHLLQHLSVGVGDSRQQPQVQLAPHLRVQPGQGLGVDPSLVLLLNTVLHRIQVCTCIGIVIMVMDILSL